jgi:Putative metal-binding motif
MRHATLRLVLMTLALGTANVWGATGVSLVASPYQSPGAGDDLVVSLTANQADGVTSMDLVSSFDPALLTPTGVFVTGYSHGASLTFSFATPGVVEVHLNRATAFSGSGDAAWVTFRVAPGTPPGTVTPLSWVSTSFNGGAIACAQQGAILAIGSAPATIAVPRGAFGLHGTQVFVPISAGALSGGSSLDLTVTFDPNVLSAASVQKTTFTSCMSLVSNVSVPGTVRISLFGLCTLTGSGPLAMIAFNVVGPNGSRTPLNMTRGAIDEEKYPTVLADGLFNVCGTPDADGDGYSVCAGDCNDGDPAVHPGAVETCNGIDDDCNGIVDDAATPKGIPSVSVEQDSGTAFLSWPPVPTATAYDIVRGNLAPLANHIGSLAQTSNSCLGSRVSSNFVIDESIPPDHDGFWYLVRPANCGGPGTFDDAGPRRVGSRDPGLNAAPSSCP